MNWNCLLKAWTCSLHCSNLKFNVIIQWRIQGAHLAPQGYEIISFWHTNFTKCSCTGNWCAPHEVSATMGNFGSATVINYDATSYWLLNYDVLNFDVTRRQVFCLCFLGTERTLILDSRGWRYSSGGWEKVFKTPKQNMYRQIRVTLQTMGK